MATTNWTLDPIHTQVEVSVRHMMFTKVRGHFTDVSGSIQIDEENPERSTVRVEIGASSIDTGVADRDKHLRSADFLDAEAYPTITFVSRRVEGAFKEDGDRLRVIGDLTLHGVAREVALDATYSGHGQDPWGNQRVGFEATTEIDRREWGLTWNQALETGGVLVGTRVAIELGVQAVRAEAAEPEEAHAGV